MSRGAVVLLACLALGLVTAPSGRAGGLGLKGKLEVRALEMGYVPGARTLKLRFYPAGAAPVVELSLSDPEAIEHVLRLAELKARGARLAVEIEDGEIRAIDVALGDSGWSGQ